MKNILLATIITFIAVVTANAQLSGSAGIVTNQNDTIPDGQQCITLNAMVAGGNQTTAYTVNQITYNPPVPFGTGDTVLFHTDDLWGPNIPLPFNFCYFGVAYHKIQIGSNGEITLDTAFNGAYNNWSIPGPLPNTTQGDQTNVIMAPWEDLDPTNQGTLQYVIGGTAPNRYIAVSWNNCPLFGDSMSVDNGYCSLDHHQTSMVVLYETSNNIDIYIARKDTDCADLGGGDWNGDLAIEGIVSPSPGVFVTVPGRNATKWTAYNDAWRFAPSGPSDYTLSWYQGSTLVSTGDSAVVCPTSTTNYQAVAVINLCSGGFLTLADTVTVHVAGFGIDTAIITNQGCGVSGSILTVVTGASGPITYNWSNGQTNALDTGLIAGTYTLTVTDTAGASVTASYTVQQTVGMVLNVLITTERCFGDSNGSVALTPVGGTGHYTYLWSNGQTGATDTSLTAGLYTVTAASGTCGATATAWVTEASRINIASIQVQNGCPGNNSSIIMTDTGGTGSLTYAWSPAVSFTDSALALSAGHYSVTVSDANGCSVSAAYTITGFITPNQQLCLVTDDTTGTYNILIWQKANKQATDSFFIYRANTPDTTYAQIAAIPRDSLSEYIDNGANPSQTSYRYKINLKDTCGNYSALSNYIQTIYLQYLGSGNFQWTPYIVENESGPVLSYDLLRDTTGNGNWALVAQTLTDTALTDSDYALYPNANYEVEAVLNVQCTPSRSISSVTSNIITHVPTGVAALTHGHIALVPNPAHNQFEIINSNTQDNIQSLTIFDQLGNKLTVPYSISGAGKLTADITTLAAGMYYVQINCNNNCSVLKMVKQ